MSALKSYSVYGIGLATDFDFTKLLPPAAGPPDVTFECVTTHPVANDWSSSQHLYPSDGEKAPVSIHRFSDHLGVRFAGSSDFHIWDKRIVCHVRGGNHTLVPNQLLGIVLALWLEERGIHTLHASASVIDQGAVAFLSDKGGGKTSTMASLTEAGHPMLSEDLLAIEEYDGMFLARPGYPQMRMWPQDALRFGLSLEGLELYHPSFPKRWVPVGSNGFGIFCNEAQPLIRIYVLEPTQDEAVEITPISTPEAVMFLTAGSFLPDLGRRAARFHFFADLAATVPVRRLHYSKSLWTDVQSPILHDLAGI
jgi:hypothetical protein